MTTLAYEEQRLVEGLRNGDEAAFEWLLDRYSASMTRIARLYVRSPAVADEVVQDAWLGVLEGVHRFEGRSSLKTWIFRILTNIAKTRGEREGRTLPFSALGDDEVEPSVDPRASSTRRIRGGPITGLLRPDAFPKSDCSHARRSLSSNGRSRRCLPPSAP